MGREADLLGAQLSISMQFSKDGILNGRRNSGHSLVLVQHGVAGISSGFSGGDEL